MFRFRKKKGAADAPDSAADGSAEEAAAIAPEDHTITRDPGERADSDDTTLMRDHGASGAADAPETAVEEPGAVDDEPDASGNGFIGRLKSGLTRSRSAFAEGLGNLLLGEKELDEDLLEELETQLLVADVGVDASTEIVEGLTARVKRRQLNDAHALLGALRDDLSELLRAHHRPLEIPAEPRPFVILVVGVNGVGKTTTIGKLARRFKDAGLLPILAAGDTFRAAAVEQLQRWGERNEVEVVAQGEGADTASVIFDALSAAKSRGADVVLADTAGRLHNKANLMEELAKIGRVMKRFDETAPHAVLLVLDAATGQNALAQAREFGQAVDLTGIVLTKLDGTAKGGIAFAIARQTGLPIQFIGIGEAIEDLRPFDPEAFVAALLDVEAG
jgi:fused signal recognition particle receptor